MIDRSKKSGCRTKPGMPGENNLFFLDAQKENAVTPSHAKSEFACEARAGNIEKAHALLEQMEKDLWQC